MSSQQATNGTDDARLLYSIEMAANTIVNAASAIKLTESGLKERRPDVREAAQKAAQAATRLWQLLDPEVGTHKG